MNTILVDIALLLALLWVRAMIRKRRAHAELVAFFRDRQIPIVAIRRPDHITYGHPGYVVVFGSGTDADAFRRSIHFTDFLRKVQLLHAKESHFQAERAVALQP